MNSARSLFGICIGCSFLLASAAKLPAQNTNPNVTTTNEPFPGFSHFGAYHGPVVKGADTQTLSNKVMCGYQGWFGAPGDGSSANTWIHWTKHSGPMADGNAKVDLWPDVSELGPDELFPTGFEFPHGRTANVFSSYKKATVLRHFKWMQDYGIDGAFVQRFISSLANPAILEHNNTVLDSCREGANRCGRAYAVMYDLSGMPGGHAKSLMADWRALRLQMHITDDPAYLHHHGKPVVAVWGIGFSDRRPYTLADCRQIIEFLKNDPEVGGCEVMLGIPTYWREMRKDAVRDPELLDIVALGDIISPWTVGRYADIAGVNSHAQNIIVPDLAWCREHHADYLPVVFPGFSWHNMYSGPLNQVPRRRGEFLWSQISAAKRAGANMIYVAMFDEVDEGTAIFKCANEVPSGTKSKFLTFDGLPSDYYLKLVGAGGKLMRGEITPDVQNALPPGFPAK